jgi:anti-sigma regulatory factor (Ser/Thr protein kinase)
MGTPSITEGFVRTGSGLYVNDSRIMYITPRFRRTHTHHTSLFNTLDLHIDASSHDDQEMAKSILEEEASRWDTDMTSSAGLIFAGFEAVENLATHNYKFAPGGIITIHARFTPAYIEFEFMAHGVPDRERLINAFREARQFMPYLQSIQARKLAKEDISQAEALDLLKNRKGLKAMMIGSDMLAYDVFDGDTYITLRKLYSSKN